MQPHDEVQELLDLRGQLADLDADGKLSVLFLSDQITSRHKRMEGFELGMTLRQMAAESRTPRRVCLLDGEPVLQEDWDYAPVAGDRVCFVELIEGGGGAGGSNPLRTILQLVVIAAAMIFAPEFAPELILNGFTAGLTGSQVTALLQIGIIIVGNALINLALPIRNPATPSATGTAGSSVYDIALQGNSAKLNNPIPVIYGSHITYPDFAAQPYSIYDSAGDQYYFALMCVGMGEYQILMSNVFIDDTRIDHFEGVQVVIGSPTDVTALVNPNVVTAVEVSGQELHTDTMIGPFTACGGGLTTSVLSLDIIFPVGIGYQFDDGSIGPLSISWRVYARPVDTFGNPTAGWFIISTETQAAASFTPIRQTWVYGVPSGRYEVRVKRMDTEMINDIKAAHKVNWAALRCYLDQPAPLDPRATYIAVAIKASEQLNGLSQRRIAVLAERKLPIWNPVTGLSAPVLTRNWAWAALDCLINVDYGGNVPGFRVDTLALLREAQNADIRGDKFDYVFDQRTTTWDALALIARTARTTRFMRGGVFTFVRDEQQTTPVTLFSSRNINRGSLSLEYIIPTEDSPDGIEVQFFNRYTWAEDYYTLGNAKLLLNSDTPPQNPQRVQMPGITTRSHAAREAYYTLAANLYRRKVVSFSTEMDGFIPALGDLCALSHDVPAFGAYRGEVEYFDINQPPVTVSGALVFAMRLSEPVAFQAGQNYIVFQTKDGKYQGPYPAYPHPEPMTIYVHASMTFTDGFFPNTGSDYDRTAFSFGPSTNIARNIRILGITPRSMEEIGIVAVVEDNRVHTADLFVGNIDPTGPTTPVLGGGGGGFTPDPDDPNFDAFYEVNLPDAPVNLDATVSYNQTTNPLGSDPIAGPTDAELATRYAGFELRPNGAMYGLRGLPQPFSGEAPIPNNVIEEVPAAWLLQKPITSDIAARFEVKVEAALVPGYTGDVGTFTGALTGPSLNTWFNLGTLGILRWTVAPTVASGQLFNYGFKVSIRLVAGGVVQDVGYVVVGGGWVPSFFFG